MKNLKAFFWILAIAMLQGCAASYRAINPPGLNYNSNGNDAKVNFEYKYDLLPKKYSKKETKFGVKLVAVKITNNSGKDLIFDETLKVAYNNGNEITLLNNTEAFTLLKQQSPYYLFYLLFTGATFDTYKSEGANAKSSSTPIGLVIGPGLTLGNILFAENANSKFKDELNEYNLRGVTIKNGETKYGLIGFRASGFDALKVKVKE